MDPEDLWITDIVKVYLYPEEAPIQLQVLFPVHDICQYSQDVSQLAWSRMVLKRAGDRQSPLVITLGEVCARVIGLDKKSPSKQLLDGSIKELVAEPPIRVVHLAHPQIRRRDPDWDRRTRTQIARLAPQLQLI